MAKEKITFEKLQDGANIITVQGENVHGDKYIKQEVVKSDIIFAMLKSKCERQVDNPSASGLHIACVSSSLPELVTQQHPEEWIASLKGIKGMIATGETEEDSINALMTSIKVMLLYNRQ
jgi:hypothetical protein